MTRTEQLQADRAVVRAKLDAILETIKQAKDRLNAAEIERYQCVDVDRTLGLMAEISACNDVLARLDRERVYVQAQLDQVKGREESLDRERHNLTIVLDRVNRELLPWSDGLHNQLSNALGELDSVKRHLIASGDPLGRILQNATEGLVAAKGRYPDLLVQRRELTERLEKLGE